MINWNDAWIGDQKLLATIKILLDGHEKLLNFLFHPTKAKLRAPSEVLLKNAQCFSSGEILLIKLALDFWDGSGKALFKDTYNGLDGRAFVQLLKAIKHRQGNL